MQGGRAFGCSRLYQPSIPAVRWALRAAATGIVPVHDSCKFSEWGSEHTPRLEHNVRHRAACTRNPLAHTPGRPATNRYAVNIF